MSQNWSLWDDLKYFDLNDISARPIVWRNRKALRLEHESGVGSGVLLREQLNLDCFRLQAEVASSGPDGFMGLIFGARDLHNYELVYISPGIDSGLGEIQYDPIMNGSSTWQIYNGPLYQAPAPVIPREWVKLSLDVQPHSVAVSVGENISPQLVIDKLQHGRAMGRIGFWGYCPVYIRNLSVEEIPPAQTDRRDADLKCLAVETYVTEWLVSRPYISDGQPAPEDNWIKAAVEENGTLNINRLYVSGEGISVQAKCLFYIPAETDSMLTFGFSDRLRLWVNDDEVYQGEWRWDPPGSDGRIRCDFASIPIRWQAGLNSIRAEITNQEVIFGWGLSMKSGLLEQQLIYP